MIGNDPLRAPRRAPLEVVRYLRLPGGERKPFAFELKPLWRSGSGCRSAGVWHGGRAYSRPRRADLVQRPDFHPNG